MTHTIEIEPGIAPCRAAPTRAAAMRSMRAPAVDTGRMASRIFALRVSGSVGDGIPSRAFVRREDS
jgi:hypothetical protein